MTHRILYALLLDICSSSRWEGAVTFFFASVPFFWLQLQVNFSFLWAQADGSLVDDPVGKGVGAFCANFVANSFPVDVR